MKKYTIEQVSKLLANKTHSVYCNVNEFELLRKILKLAFPNDSATENYQFDFECYYGYNRRVLNNWANIGEYLQQLKIIKLSDIFNIDLPLKIETVTISKEDYDRFLKLESKVKKSDEKFLDKCAIEAMNAYISTYSSQTSAEQIEGHSGYISKMAYVIANEMLTERNKNK